MPPVVEAVEHELCVMTKEGDLKTIWDAENAEEVAAAKKQFDEMKKKGFMAYTVKKAGGKGEIMHEFDPEADASSATPA